MVPLWNHPWRWPTPPRLLLCRAEQHSSMSWCWQLQCFTRLQWVSPGQSWSSSLMWDRTWGCLLPLPSLCRMYSLNWEESTPPPHEHVIQKPLCCNRSKTCRRTKKRDKITGVTPTHPTRGRSLLRRRLPAQSSGGSSHWVGSDWCVWSSGRQRGRLWPLGKPLWSPRGARSHWPSHPALEPREQQHTPDTTVRIPAPSSSAPAGTAEESAGRNGPPHRARRTPAGEQEPTQHSQQYGEKVCITAWCWWPILMLSPPLQSPTELRKPWQEHISITVNDGCKEENRLYASTINCDITWWEL